MKNTTRWHRMYIVLATLSSTMLLQVPTCNEIGAEITKGLTISISNELIRNTINNFLDVQSFSFF